MLVHVKQRQHSYGNIRWKRIHNKSRGGPELISGPAGGTIISDQCGWLTAGGVFTKHLPFPTSKQPQHQFTGTLTQHTINVQPTRGGGGKSLNGGPPQRSANVLPGHIDASKRTLEYQSGGFNPGAEGCTRGEGGLIVTPRGHSQR